MRSIVMVVAVLLCASVFLFAQSKVTVEQSPNKSSTVYHVSDAPFDLQFSYNLEVVTGALGNAGSEFDGTYYYSTRWASNLLHKVDMTGVLVEQFSIPGVTGLRDLAYDGAFMYGGAAANTIYQMDFVSKTLIGTIPSPVAVRHIAYDEAADAFWVGTWDTPPTLVSRTGQVLGTVTSGLLSQYGSAYDKWTSGGPYLWVFNQGAGAGTPQYVHQIDLNTGTPTGVTYDVLSDFLPNAQAIAGGLWAGEGVAPGKASLGGVMQGTPDIFFVYELADAGAPTDPNPPSNFTAYSDFTTPTAMDLNWTSPSTYINGNPLPAGTTIKISRDGSQIASVPLATQNYTDTGLSDGTLYSYQIWADDGLGAVSAPANASWYAGGSPVPAAPTGLSGNGTTTNATLTWTDPTTQEDGTPLDDLDHINIYRNGVLVGNVAPGVQTYVDAPPPGFVYTYTVTAVDDETPPNESDPSNAAPIYVGGLPNILVWVGPGALGVSAASGDSIFEALVANGESCYLTNNLFEFGSDLSVYEAIFVVLGIYANNHVIAAADPEGPALEAYLASGGHIYLEGGDCFNYDPEVGGYQIRPWFSLNDGNDGSADLLGITGLNDLSAFAFQYTGENNFMDELVPVSSTPVWKNSANADLSGVFYAGFGGRSIGVVPSFGGLVDSPEPLNPARRTLENYFPQELAGSAVKPPRAERTAPAPFTKKAAYYPERKVERSPENSLYKITPNGVEILANTKEDLMAAYLDFFRISGDPEITVDPTAFSDTLLIGDSKTNILSITNSGSTTAGPLTYSISEVPPVGWLSVNPTSGSITVTQTEDVSVMLDATGLTAGNYSTNLEITHNGVNVPSPVVVTVDLLVNDAPIMVVSPDMVEDTLPPATTSQKTFNISNPGVGPLEFAITIEGVAAAN
ncbi:MAG: hypothetical protein L6Q94_07825, partial [Calditrichia bacterium]|nr:hypothetical protein [Calditrichia bacterium]